MLPQKSRGSTKITELDDEEEELNNEEEMENTIINQNISHEEIAEKVLDDEKILSNKFKKQEIKTENLIAKEKNINSISTIKIIENFIDFHLSLIFFFLI